MRPFPAAVSQLIWLANCHLPFDWLPKLWAILTLTARPNRWRHQNLFVFHYLELICTLESV